MGHSQATRGGGVGFVKLLNNFRGVLQIGDWLPCPFGLIVAFPMHQVLEFPFINTGINNSVDFVLFVAILSDVDRSRARNGLTRQWAKIRFYPRDVHNWVNTKRFRELKLNCVRHYT